MRHRIEVGDEFSLEECKLLVNGIDSLPIRDSDALPLKDVVVVLRKKCSDDEASFKYLLQKMIDYMLPIGAIASPRDQVNLYLRLRDRNHTVPEQLQQIVDDLLRDLMAGARAETVLQHAPRKDVAHGNYRNIRESQLRCFEVLRLAEITQDEAVSKDLVAGAFDVDLRTVERALDGWRDVIRRERVLDQYVANLRALGFLQATK